MSRRDKVLIFLALTLYLLASSLDIPNGTGHPGHAGLTRDAKQAIGRHFGKADRPAAEAVALCESHSDTKALSPGGRYRGLWQFWGVTWRNLGGTGDPTAATAEEQTRIARRLWVSGGRKFSLSWPICGRGR